MTAWLIFGSTSLLDRQVGTVKRAGVVSVPGDECKEAKARFIKFL